MKNLYLILSSLIFIGLIFTSAAHAQKLSGEWKLVEATQNGRRVALGRDIRTSATFSEENRLAGNAGCNRYSTTYTREGGGSVRNRITFQPIISTKMACMDNTYMKQENTFFAVMENVRKYRISGNYLILSDLRERNVLRFRRVSR